jgi:uncharacterized protein
MLHPISLEGPADLAVLENFLASDRAPPECMQLAELDGFLAGLVVGPEAIPPSEWLPMIWHEGEPAFADLAEMQAILGVITRRYNEILRLLDTAPLEYQPVFALQDDDSIDASDWTLGFLQAVALREHAWEPLLNDPLAGVLLSPIVLVASTTDKANLPLDDDELLPDAEMAKLLAGADALLGMCVAGMRAFFQERRRPRRRKRAARKVGGRAKAKRR